jgi:cysteine desulfurase/selenocysteine lyase
MTTLDIQKIRADFPILHQKVNNRPLVYFDNAATSQKPKVVIDTVSDYYTRYNSNIHRGAHYLAQQATEAYEDARKYIATYLNAKEDAEINFLRGTTEAVNLVANGYGRKFLTKGDEIIISTLEHHANIVPWQMLCEQTGAVLKVIPINDAGELLMDAYAALLSDKTKIVSVTYVSNALGTINPVKEIIAQAHAVGAKVFLDGAQALPHKKVDVQALDCDWLAFSGHKVLAPTGIGVLYGKRQVLEAMDPYMGGGEMIDYVSFEKTTYNKIPFKFEAGTPNISGGIALAAALRYMDTLGVTEIEAYEQELLAYGTEQMKTIEGIQFVGTAKNKASVISFVVQGCHNFDIGTLLDAQGVAIRLGHHCTQPLWQRLGLEGTCRASFAFYNTFEEIDIFIAALQKSINRLR